MQDHNRQREMGLRIKAQRLALKYTQEQMHLKTGLRRQSYGDIERGRRKMDVYELMQISQILEKSVSYILTGEY